jgi:hypothetical protein
MLSSTGVTVKTLDYLSSENDVAKLCYLYKEMVWDNTLDSGAAFTSIDGTVQTTCTLGEYYSINTPSGKILALCVRTGDYVVVELSDVNGKLMDLNNVLCFTLWDGNGFGDNNQFEVRGNQSTQTDDNGNAVLFGTASFNTQYFITKE